jgi:hypothetical protein
VVSFNVPKYRFHSLIIIKWCQIYFQDYQSPSQEYFEREYFFNPRWLQASIAFGEISMEQTSRFLSFVNTNYGFLLHNLHREFFLCSCKAFAPVLHFIISTKIDIQLISSSSEIEVSVIKS